MRNITLRFSKRERYVKAINHIWANPNRYKVIVRGKDFGAAFKDARYDCGWYIEYQTIG